MTSTYSNNKKAKTCFAQACRLSGSPSATTVAAAGLSLKEEGPKGESKQ
jgi:hypothetical protein